MKIGGPFFVLVRALKRPSSRLKRTDFFIGKRNACPYRRKEIYLVRFLHSVGRDL